MSTTPSTFSMLSASASRALTAARPIDQASTSSTLDGERRGDDARRRDVQRDRRQPHLCRFETSDCAPLWNGPALRADFVAQVIGQVMTAEAELRPAARTYHRAQIAPALLFDTRI